MKSKFDRDILSNLESYSSEVSVSGEDLIRLHANELPWKNEAVILALRRASHQCLLIDIQK